VLEVSSIGIIDRVWICLQPPERVCKTSKTKELCYVSTIHDPITRSQTVIHAKQHSFLEKAIRASAEGGVTAIVEQILST
jgi:hypothetical protein